MAIRPYRNVEVMAYPIGTSQTFAANAAVTLTAGEVTAITGVPTGSILGVALDPAVWPNGMPALTQGVEPIDDQHVVVALAKDDTEFEGNLEAAQATAVSLIGTTADLTESGGDYFLDVTTPAQNTVVITGLIDPVGTVAGRVSFRVVSADTVLDT